MNIEVLEQLLEEYKKIPESKQSVIDVCTHTLDFIKISLSERETENLDTIRELDNEFEANIDLTPITTPEERSKIPIREVNLEYGNGQTEVFYIPDDPRYFEKSLLAIFDTARELVMIDRLAIMLNSTTEKTLEDFSKVIPEDFQKANISISANEVKRIKEYNAKNIVKPIERAGFQNFIMAIVCRLSLNEAFRLNATIQTRISSLNSIARYPQKNQSVIPLDMISRNMDSFVNDKISTIDLAEYGNVDIVFNSELTNIDNVITQREKSILNLIYSYYDYRISTTGTLGGVFTVDDILKRHTTSKKTIEDFNEVVHKLRKVSIKCQLPDGRELDTFVLPVEIITNPVKKDRSPYQYITMQMSGAYFLSRQTRQFDIVDDKFIFPLSEKSKSSDNRKRRIDLDYVAIKLELIQNFKLVQSYTDKVSKKPKEYYVNHRYTIDYSSEDKTKRQNERRKIESILDEIIANADGLKLNNPRYEVVYDYDKENGKVIGYDLFVEPNKNKPDNRSGEPQPPKPQPPVNNKPNDPKRFLTGKYGSISRY